MASNLLEYFNNTVTNPVNEDGARFEVAKCNCRCWFCPECCAIQGYNLRARLIPIVETFSGLIMASLTIDPGLFPDPITAYLYTMEKRCISVTTRELDRWGYLNTRRYFYVVEWQKNTEQAHYHILYDTSYIPWNSLLHSWSKHRPLEAGPVIGKRPAFGTVRFSAPEFADPIHAARYATKYLIKYPEYGFPQWVLDMGADKRIRRYGTSRPFWNNPKQLKNESKKTRKNRRLSYKKRIDQCGDSVNIFEIKNSIDIETGEIKTVRNWKGNMDVPANVVLESLFDPGNPKRKRRSLLAQNLQQAKYIIENAAYSRK